MSPFLAVTLGALFLVASFCLAVLWIESGNNYKMPVLPGQRWKIKGLGVVIIKEVLNGGKYYPQYGGGTNTCYITETGRVGYCSKYTISRYGTLIKNLGNVAFVADDFPEGTTSSNDHKIYNRFGKIVGDEKETIDAEFCDPPPKPSNVYHLLPRHNNRQKAE